MNPWPQCPALQVSLAPSAGSASPVCLLPPASSFSSPWTLVSCHSGLLDGLSKPDEDLHLNFHSRKQRSRACSFLASSRAGSILPLHFQGAFLPNSFGGPWSEAGKGGGLGFWQQDLRETAGQSQCSDSLVPPCLWSTAGVEHWTHVPHIRDADSWPLDVLMFHTGTGQKAAAPSSALTP